MRRWLARSLLQFPSEREQYSSETRSQIVTHRLLCLLGMGFVPTFGFLYGLSNPNPVDPVWARFALSGLFGGLFLASFWSDHVRRNYALWMRGLLYLLMAWFTAVATLNHFTSGYVLGLLLTYSVLITVVGVGARSLGPVLRFEVGGLLLTGGGLLYASAPESSSIILLSCLATVAFVETIAIQGQITTRETLRDRETHLRGIANSLPGVIFQFAGEPDGTYGFNFVSDHAEELLGLPPDADDMFECFIHNVPPRDREAVVESIDSAVEGTHSWRQEMPYERPSGEQRWLLGAATPDERTEALVFNGVVLDIGAQKQAERQARLQTQVLDQVMKGVPFRDILADLVKSIEEQRPRMKGSILLYDESEGRIRHGAAPNLPSGYNRAIDGLEVGPKAGSCGTAMYTGSPVIAEDIAEDPRWEEYRDLAGEYGLCACWSVPFRDSEGQILGTFAMYYDEPRAPAEADRTLIDRARSLASVAIERHRNAKELRLLSEAVRQSTDGVVILESDGSEQLPGPITYVNEAFTEMTGYEMHDVIGKSPELLHGPDTEPWVLQRLAKRLEAGSAFEGEAVHYRKDGTPFVSHMSMTPVRDDRGRITHWVSVQRDVTAERKTGERMLEVHDEERRRIDKEIRQEMGGLLATLQMTLGVVRGEMKERGVPTDRIQEVEALVQEVSRLARTISDRLHPTPLGDHGLLEILPSLLKRIEERYGLEVHLQTDVESEDDIGSLVQMIAFHVVNEALWNVVQHAETDEADVVVRQGLQEVQLDIVDEGEGFDPAQIEHEETYGLFGMKKRVERLNGRLDIHAAAGRGTHISVTLPMTTAFADTVAE